MRRLQRTARLSMGLPIIGSCLSAPLSLHPEFEGGLMSEDSSDVQTMDEIISASIASQRFSMILFAAFAALALLLSSIGIYGVISYLVGQQTREIGLRMALGAAPGRVRAMVLKQVAWMTLVGGIIGLAGAVGVGYSAGSILFELKAWDPAVLAVSAVLLTAVAIAAGFVPARRASLIDPMRALRYE